MSSQEVKNKPHPSPPQRGGSKNVLFHIYHFLVLILFKVAFFLSPFGGVGGGFIL